MPEDIWHKIVADGINRGFDPENASFFVDMDTKTGMIWYCGRPWLFGVEVTEGADL